MTINHNYISLLITIIYTYMHFIFADLKKIYISSIAEMKIIIVQKCYKKHGNINLEGK